MKKLFTSDKFFLATVLIAVIGSVFGGAVMFALCQEVTMNAIILIISAICILVVYTSYLKHSKNVMKGMIGASLISIVICEIQGLTTSSSSFDLAFSVIFVILGLALYINHFIINSNRNPSPANVAVNQIVAVLYAIANVMWMIFWIPLADSPLEIAAYIAYIFTIIGIVAAIICVESRLDAYRLDREAAGWTEDKGYPEGYVHEFEKK